MKSQYILFTFALGILFISCKKENPAQTAPKKTTPLPATTNDTSVTDIDGNVYHTIKIGSQLWMKENLKVMKYRNGDSIHTTTTSTKDVSLEIAPKYQWSVNGNDSNTTEYGKLYSGYVVTDARGLCPTNWHVPSQAEFTTLITLQGVDTIAGGKLKESGFLHWISPNYGANNLSGFTALPAGSRGYSGSYSDFTYDAYFWSSTENSSTSEYYIILNTFDRTVQKNQYYKNMGYSVRCVKD